MRIKRLGLGEIAHLYSKGYVLRIAAAKATPALPPFIVVCVLLTWMAQRSDAPMPWLVVAGVILATLSFIAGLVWLATTRRLEGTYAFLEAVRESRATLSPGQLFRAGIEEEAQLLFAEIRSIQQAASERLSSRAAAREQLAYLISKMPWAVALVSLSGGAVEECSGAFKQDGLLIALQGGSGPGRQDTPLAWVLAAAENAPITTTLSVGGKRYLCRAEVVEFYGEDKILLSLADVTELSRAREQLEIRQNELACVVESSVDGVLILDSELRLLSVNEGGLALFGLTSEEQLPRSGIWSLFDQKGAEALEDTLWGLVEDVDVTRRPFLFPTRLAPRKAGMRGAYEVKVSTIGFAQHRKCILVIRDMTKEDEEAHVKEQQQQAQAASAAKTAFLAKMSHEIRTPLNALLGFANLAKEAVDMRPPKEEDASRHLASVHLAGNQLLALIDDVLDLARIEAGALSVSVAPLKVGMLLADVVRLSQPAARQYRVELPDEGALRSLEYTALADPVRLQQVFSNIVSNSIKYNKPNGAVTIQVDVTNDAVMVSVEDTGAGMSPDQMRRLYEPFNRLGKERGNVPGTGIGLALSRELVCRMQGSLEAFSTLGKGTTITIRLKRATRPAGAETAGVVEKEDSVSLADLRARILYVEDMPTNSAFVRAVLKQAKGIVLDIRDTGKDGFDQARRERPDLILLDMNLPDCTGLEFIDWAQREPGLREVPIIVLSADAMLEDIATAKAAGARDYWTKPLQVQKFRRDLAREIEAAQKKGRSDVGAESSQQ